MSSQKSIKKTPENSRSANEFSTTKFSKKDLLHVLEIEKFRALLSLTLSIVLFVGGIALTLSQIQILNILIGIPPTIIGIAFIVITFDNLNQLSLEDES